MVTLKRRLAALELRTSATIKRWHRILRFADQTEAEAIAAYEDENGPIGPDDGRILRVIIHKPFPAPQEAGSHAT